jgi:sulfite reductase (NADPH) flavoprotein alpha-component
MSAVPLIPDTAPFTPEQRAWLNGFLAGVFSRAPAPSGSLPSPASAALTPLTILYGSQTGTAEMLSKQAAKEAGKRGFAPMVLDMAQADAARLAQEKNLLVITSTYGEGEPPDNAKALHTALAAAAQNASLKLSPEARFSVCALGDTNYTLFCQCGKDFDTFLEKLGATRAAPRADCELDYEAKFTAWLDSALGALAGGNGTGTAPASVPTPAIQTETGYSRKNPFPARVLTVRSLNGVGSSKEVNHVEFSLADSGLSYAVGDALGVVPQNCPTLVADVLTVLGCDGEEAVPSPDGSTTSLRRALTELYDLGKPSAELLALVGADTAVSLHVIDALLAASGTKPAPAALIGVLKKIQPRLYSISSSPKAREGQVHLTVGAVRYEAGGRRRKGVCSTFLAERALATGTTGVFVHSNHGFRPPADGATPMIMVGPGTGIAPFRAFLEERRAIAATGKNWLFFGDQRAATDFLYRDELLAFQRDGHLARLDLAFSRDQAEKIYVQQRMMESATELFAWLEAGAHFYVCGDASRMAKDVDAALHTVVAIAGKKSADEAAAYVAALRTAKRYQRDVY